MLLQQQNAETGSASLTRVTSEELARAIAAVEARRHAGLERDMDTIALGEAIRQLGLDMTAEELLAEVRAQREAVEAEAVQAVEAERQRDQAAVAELQTKPRRPLWRRAARAIAAAALVCLVINGSPTSPYVQRLLLHEPMTVDDAVAWNIQRPVALTTILDVARGHSARRVSIRDGGERRWYLVSLYGKPAVRGYTDGVVKDGRLRVYSSWPAGRSDNAVAFHEITVSLSRLRNMPDPPDMTQSALYARGIEVMNIPAK
jgi:hypothetical protein